MSKIGKKLPPTLSAHLKPATKRTTPEKTQVQNLWLENIHIQGADSPRIHKDRQINIIKHNHTNAHCLALKVLFPGHLIEDMLRLRNMPESTLEEKITKENAFRNILLQQYHIREVIADKNCGLRAIINCLHPEMDPNSEEITATILRGDIISHLKNHPESFYTYNGAKAIKDPELLKASLEDYCLKMVQSDAPIGPLELEIMSEILETPISVFSYQKPRIGAENEILAKDECCYGKDYKAEPICLYFDPVKSQYHPMEKLDKRVRSLSP